MIKYKPKGHAYLLPTVLGATLLLSGCWGKTLDFRNAEVVNGKIFSNGANSPFSGRVTNMPRFRTLDEGALPIEQALKGLITLDYNFLGNLCDVTVKDGTLQGKGVCRPVRSDQVTSEFSVDNGVLQSGFKVFSSTSGEVIAEANFDNGRLDGKMLLSNPDSGKLIYKTKLKQGKQDGDAIRYTLDGQYPLYKGSFVDGKRDGVEEFYHPTTHKLIAKITWENDVKNGSEKEWSNDGSALLIDLNWTDGKAAGFQKQFDATGAKLLVDLTFKDGKATGFQTVGDTGENSTGYNEYHVKDGLYDGVHKAYDFRRNTRPSGMFLYKVDNFKEGILDGKSQTFGEDGTIVSESNYRDGIEIPLPTQRVPELNNQANISNIEICVDSWTAAYRKEVGQDAWIKADQLDEWKNWCKEGKIPQ